MLPLIKQHNSCCNRAIILRDVTTRSKSRVSIVLCRMLPSSRASPQCVARKKSMKKTKKMIQSCSSNSNNEMQLKKKSLIKKMTKVLIQRVVNPLLCSHEKLQRSAHRKNSCFSSRCRTGLSTVTKLPSIQTVL